MRHTNRTAKPNIQTFFEALLCAVKFTSNDNKRPVLQYVHVYRADIDDRYHVLATDSHIAIRILTPDLPEMGRIKGFRLHRDEITNSLPSDIASAFNHQPKLTATPAPAPAPAIELYDEDKDYTGVLHFNNGKNYSFDLEYKIKRMEAYRKIFEIEQTSSFITAKASELADEIEAITSAFGKPSKTGEFSIVLETEKGNSVNIACNRTTGRKTETTDRCVSSTAYTHQFAYDDDDDMAVVFDQQYLLDALAVFGDDEIYIFITGDINFTVRNSTGKLLIGNGCLVGSDNLPETEIIIMPKREPF